MNSYVGLHYAELSMMSVKFDFKPINKIYWLELVKIRNMN